MANDLIIEEPGYKKDKELVLERPSDPGKQFIAGLSDIGTGIPAVLGLAGAGIQAGYNTLFDEGSIGENFKSAMTDEGIDQWLLSKGLAGRENVNEFLGIKEAVSTEDQAARLLGSFIPIPGLQLASGAGKLAKAANLALNLTTPIVKRGKGFGRRAVGQLGIGLALDQGIRAVQGSPEFPLILSDEALGKTIDIEGIPSGDISAGTDSGDLIIEPLVEELVPDGPIFDQGQDGFEARRELDLKVARQDEWEDAKTWMLIAGAVFGSFTAAKWAQRIAGKKALSISPFGTPEAKVGKIEQFATDIDPTNILEQGPAYIKEYPGILNRARKDASSYIGEAFVDRSKALANSLRDMGYSNETIKHMVANSHIDTAGMAENVLDTGVFGQGFVGGVKNGAKSADGSTWALRDLEVEHAALGNNRVVFDKAMVAQTEQASRINAQAPSLWGAGRTDDELAAFIKAARDDKQMSTLMDKFSDVFDSHLRYQVHRKLIDVDTAQAFRGKFSVEGKLAYMPLYSASRKSFFRRMGRKFGIHTRKGREMDLMGEHHFRSQEGVELPLGPVEALRQYTIHSIDQANTQAFHMQSLSALAGVEIKQGKATVRFFVDEAGNRRTTDIIRDRSGRGTKFIGEGEIDDFGDVVNVKVRQDDPQVTGLFKNGSAAEIKARAPDAVMVVHHEGKAYLFHVPDAPTRAALDLRPELGTALHFMNHWKGVFTKLTTGNLSLFSPISHLFSAQQVALATTAREGLRAGARSFGEGLRGTKELFLTNSSKEIAQFLSHRIATHTGVAKLAPAAVKRLQQRLERRFRDSMLNPVRGETGRISSGLHSDTFTGSVADFSDSVGRNFGQTFGQDQMGLAWRLWKGWNTALHEGPAFGAMLKHIGTARLAGKKIDPRIIREAVDLSKSVAGDMRRLGGSQAAKAFNASVPFSAAMIQSWNALGSAAMHDWSRFILGASALIGIPTLTEMGYNFALSQGSGTFTDPSGKKGLDGNVKEWTYNDYYWNGFTTQQRADNMIVFVPGKPPWEALIYPISPEWGLFRGAVMEAADAIFNFSDVGAIGQVGKGDTGRDQFYAAFNRVLDIPVPPLVAAAFSATGTDVRFGVQVEKEGGPDDPGTELKFLRFAPVGQGERVTRRSGRAKFVGSTLDSNIVAMIQDIMGSGGALYVAVHEAYKSGKRLDPEGSTLAGVTAGAEALGTGLRRQARWTQPLFGKTLRPSANDEIARDLFNRRENLKGLAKNFNSYRGGGLVDTSGFPSVGNTEVPPDDPINLELSADAQDVLNDIGLLDESIAGLRRQLSKMGNATNLGSQAEKYDQMDSKTLEIQALKARQLATIIDYEARASDTLSKRYRRTVDINLGTYAPRSSLPEGSIFQELKTPPPKTQ